MGPRARARARRAIGANSEEYYIKKFKIILPESCGALTGRAMNVWFVALES